jgi:putative ABC transport system permease protein
VGLKTVRHYKVLFVGSFLTMVLGVALIGISAGALSSTWLVPDTTTGPMVTLGGLPFHRDAVDMQGITTVLALAAVTSGFIMITNVSATFAFSIALRRRDLGLFRLLGSSGGQMRRMVLGEALVVAIPAAACGAAIAAAATPPVMHALNKTDLTPVQLPVDVNTGALVFAYGLGIVLALLAALLAAGRAVKVRPAEALRDAQINANAMTKGRWIVGVLTLAAGVLMLVLVPSVTANDATALTIFGTFALVIASAALGPVGLPVLVLVRIFGRFIRLGVSGRLAVASAVTSRRNTASLAAPVLSVIAVVGIMLGVLLTTNASDLADQIARTKSQLVVEPANGQGLDQSTVQRLVTVPGVRAVSAPSTVKLAFATPGDPRGDLPDHGGSGMVTASTPDLLKLADVQEIAAVEGTLHTLTGNEIAVRKEFISWYNVHAGSILQLAFFDGRTVNATISAIVDGGASLPQIMLPAALAESEARPPHRADVLLAAGVDETATAKSLAALGNVRVTPKADWYAADAAEQNRIQNLVLLVLAGPASLFALIAVANTVVMAFSRRGREIAGMTLLGVSSGQVRRMVVKETLLVTGLAVGVAAVLVTTGLAGYRTALAGSHLDTALGVPWAVLVSLAAACLLAATVAGLLAAGRELRRPAVRMITARE